MFYLNRLFSNRSLKTLLAISLFILIAVVIWYLGPFLGFGKTRPLEPVEPRVVFILLAFIALTRLWWKVPLFVIVAIAACALIWELGPHILTGDVYPLSDALNRLVVMAIIALLTLIYGAWRLLLALSANPALLANLMKFRRVDAESGPDISEAAAVIKNAAIWASKTHGTHSWWRRFFLAKSWREELPWYMVLGAENAGKTSLIAASGQDFPLPEQLNRIGKEPPATKNCECWFANDALLIDTSGKYISQEQSWSPEWHGILKAIGKYRPIQAINGAIVVLSAADIMQSPKHELLAFAAAIRARLDEIRSQLGVRFPVYVVISKLDRLAGFEEYFRYLTEDGREQVLGVTFPYGNKEKTSVEQLHKNIREELTLLEERIDGNINHRQQEEYAIADRKKMYALPQDFRVLSQIITEVLQNIFFASRYDETQFYTSLRGIYFASSCQQETGSLKNNATLIQRWRNYFNAKDSQQVLPAQSLDETEKLISNTGTGRHYFLKTLFSEIIIKDASLVRYNLRMETRYRLRNFAGHCLCIGLTVWLLNAFITSFQNNTRYLDAVANSVQVLEREMATYVRTASENLLPILLTKSQSLPDFGTLNIDEPGLEYRYGLYTGKAVSRHANGMYQYLLHRALFPMIEEHAREALQSALSGQEKAKIFAALKLYLVLAGEGNFSQDYVVNAVGDQWESTGKIQPYQDRSIFNSHLNNLFSQADWRRDGQSADADLIHRARTLLAQSPVTDRLYERMKGVMEQEAPANMTLDSLTGSDSVQIFTLSDEDLQANGVPGLFTWAGYHEVYKKKAPLLVTTLWNEDRWVMGSSLASKENPLAMKDKVLKLYLREYRHYWLRLLADIQLISIGNEQSNDEDQLDGEIFLLRTLASPMSPMTHLAKELVKQTTLTFQEKSVLNNVNLNVNQTVNNLQRANSLLAFHEKKMLLAGVDNYFSPLRMFVNGSGAARSIDEQALPGTQLNRLVGILSDRYTLTVISNHALSEGSLFPVPDTAGKVIAEAQIWPHPFKNIVGTLLRGTNQKIKAKDISTTQKTIDSIIGEACRSTLQGRYPFANTEYEASLRDVEKFFAKGGLVDEYFTRNLASKVDTSASPWRFKNSEVSEGLEVFEQASAIRDALFQEADGRKLAIDLSLSFAYLSPRVTQLAVDIEGLNFKYTHEPVSSFAFHWPGRRSGVVFSAMPRQKSTVSSEALSNPSIINGPWALFRWLDKAQKVTDSANGQKIFTFNLDNRRVDIEIAGMSSGYDSNIELLRNFECPEGL